MIFRTTVFVAFLFLISCSQKKQFPDFVSEKIEKENVSLNSQLPIFNNSLTNYLKIIELEKLVIIQNQFLKKDLEFDLYEFKNCWNEIQKENDFKSVSSEDLKNWVEVSGLLLELTGEAVFAEELEKIAFLGIGETISENKRIVTPYVFTKNTDDLFINLNDYQLFLPKLF